MSVAVIDRSDKRPIPQTPWPLVQPLPTLTPVPTNKPAMIALIKLAGLKSIVGMLFPETICHKAVPTIKPIKNNHCHLILEEEV